LFKEPATKYWIYLTDRSYQSRAVTIDSSYHGNEW